MGATGAGVPSPSQAKRAKASRTTSEARGDQDEARPAEGARAVARRQRLPLGDQPGHQAGDHAGGDDQECETAKRRLDPIHCFLSPDGRLVRDIGFDFLPDRPRARPLLKSGNDRADKSAAHRSHEAICEEQGPSAGSSRTGAPPNGSSKDHPRRPTGDPVKDRAVARGTSRCDRGPHVHCEGIERSAALGQLRRRVSARDGRLGGKTGVASLGVPDVGASESYAAGQTDPGGALGVTCRPDTRGSGVARESRPEQSTIGRLACPCLPRVSGRKTPKEF